MWKSKFYGAFVLNHRVVLHAIDATPARWRGDAGSSPLDRARTAASSPRNDLVKNCRVHPSHWLISTQVVASGRAKRCDVVRCRETTSAMLRCRPRTLVLEVGGTRDDEALARELALGYRAVADVAAAVEAIHEAGVLAVDRFDFVGDV